MKGKTYMTEEWRPAIGCIQKVRAQHPRIDIEYYIEEMRDHFLGNGKSMKDWNATFRNWIRRCGNFGAVRTIRAVAIQAKPTADVVEIGTLHAARQRGIDTAGQTESQLCGAIWDHDQRVRVK